MSKSFSQLVEQLNKRSRLEERRSEADDPFSREPQDDESKELKPRAKGEREFKDKHSVEKKKHPVADDDVFQGSTKPGKPHKGHEKAGEPVIKQGSSDVKVNHDGSKTPDKSKAIPKRFGDLRVVKPVKEEVELQETAFEDIRKIAKSNREGRVHYANGRHESVDPDTAKALLNAYNKLNSDNKQKFEQTVNKDFTGMMKMVDFAMGKK
jgi:hypothetical protein